MQINFSSRSPSSIVAKWSILLKYTRPRRLWLRYTVPIAILIFSMTEYIQWEYYFNKIIVIDKFSNILLTWKVRHETSACSTGNCLTNINHAKSQQVADYVMVRTVLMQGTMGKYLYRSEFNKKEMEYFDRKNVTH